MSMDVGLDYEAAVRRAGPNWVIVGDGRRRGLIPSFYQPHRDPHGTTVKVKGIPLLSPNKRPFTVGEIPVERRWAVREDGELLDETEFRSGYERWYYEWFNALAFENPDSQPSPGKPENRGIPTARNYVSVQPSLAEPWHLEPMHYEPHPKGDRPKPDALYSRKSDEMIDRREALALAYADPNARRSMRPEEIEEVEAMMGQTSERPAGDVADKLERLQAQLIAGEISPKNYAYRVSLAVGKAPNRKKRRKKPEGTVEDPSGIAGAGESAL